MLLTRAALNLQVESLGVKRARGSDPRSLRRKPERHLILNLYRFSVKRSGFTRDLPGFCKRFYKGARRVYKASGFHKGSRI